MDKCRVSTQTFIVYSDAPLCDDLRSAYDSIRLSDALIGAKYGSAVKGVFRAQPSSAKNHLKCLTVKTTVLDDRPPTGRSRRRTGPKTVSVKIFPNGTIQLTGCNSPTHPYDCLTTVLTDIGVQDATFRIQSVMLNASFQLGQRIRRDVLGEILHEHEKINIPPLSLNSCGLKFRLAHDQPIQLTTTTWRDGRFVEIGRTAYADYFANASKKLGSTFSTSVVVFDNGKVTLSGVNEEAVSRAIEMLTKTIDSHRARLFRSPKTFIR